MLALVDDAVDIVAVELARQPADINHLEALYRAHVDDVQQHQDTPAASGLTADAADGIGCGSSCPRRR